MRPVRLVLSSVALAACTGCADLLALLLPGDVDAQLRAVLQAHNVTPVEKPAVDAAKVRLGQALFFDKILSGNRNISCATCHTPLAFTGDGLPLSIGQGGDGLAQARRAPLDDDGNPIFIPRNAPDVFNRAPLDLMFWDGRVARMADGSFDTPAGDDLLPGLDSTLAAQAMFPVTSRDEMRGHPGENDLADLDDSDLAGIWDALMGRLLAIDEYRDLFAAAYPDVPSDDLTFVHAANAIAAFEIDHWTLDDSPFDAYLRGDDSALSEAATRGALLFFGKAGCADCHTGPLLTDGRFHNRAVPQIGPGKGDGDDGTWDFGRERVTGDPADRFRFRTPPLRNVAATAPYMHDGAFATLEDAVRHELDPITSALSYDPTQLRDDVQDLFRREQTVDILAKAIDDGEVDAVALTDEEFADLLAFLHALTSPSLGTLGLRDIPAEVPSGLPLAD